MAAIPESFSPSRELNRALTPLVQSYEGKLIDKSLRFAYCEPKVVRTDNSNNRIGDLVEKFPKIYHSASFIVGVDFEERLPLVAPVGDYGDNWARQLVQSANSFIQGARSSDSNTNIIHESLRLNSDYENLLGIYTFNKTDGMMTVTEGFQSILSVAGFLTMYKVPGYEDDPDRLLVDLAHARLFSKLALAIPPGLTGTLGFRGGVFTDPTVVKGPSGLLSINPKIIEHFSTERHKEYKNESTFARARLDIPGCPLARKLPNEAQSGVDVSANLFAQTVRAQITNQKVS